MGRVLRCVPLLAALLSAPALPAREASLLYLQALVDEAGRLFDERRFEEARVEYQKAWDAGGPRELIYMVGRCQQELGRWLDARESFRVYLAGDDLDPEGKGRAELALRAVEAQLASATILVEVAPFGAAVHLDGAPVGAAPIEPLAVVPGRHTVRVEAPGHVGEEREVTVEGGRTLTLVFELPPAPPDLPPEVGAEGGADGPDYSPWTWVTLGAGVAVLVGGTVSYALGEEDHRAVADPAPDLTRRQALGLVDSGDAKKTAGAVLWGLGGACVATSVVLFVLDARDPGDAATVQVGVAPAAGGGLFVLGGEF